MEGTIYRIIGIRGRTTIPFLLRTNLKIGDNTMLKYTTDGKSVIVTPLRVCSTDTCPIRPEVKLTPEEIGELLDTCDEETLETLNNMLHKKRREKDEI